MNAPLAYTINPSAGEHPIASEPEELEAARRAGEAALREFPYYLERYGERGSRFGTSDGAWLITLCDGGTEYFRRQVLWLGRVLSSRGIPRWLLERHLEVLHGELVRLAPERAPRCEPLLNGAAWLRALRRARIAEGDFLALGAAFAERADSRWAKRLPGMGGILVAAVADEADGIDRAVESVEEWVADGGRFPERWVAAVRATLAEARRRVRTSRRGEPA